MPDRAGSSDLYLSDVSPEDKPWDVHRANASRVQTLYQDVGYERYAERIEHCSKLLGFAFEAKDSGELKLRLRHAQCCRVRFCPVCQWRRTLMWRARFFSAVPKVTQGYPTARWLFLTLTVRNCELTELRETLRHMNKSWERLSKRKQFPAMGFVRSTEVTRSQDGSAHPHFHCLLMVPASYFSTGYIKQADWSELWKQALRVDYTPIVNVKAVKPRKMTATSDQGAADQGAADQGVTIALLETLKYGVKEQDLIQDAQWLKELTKQLHKTRAVSVGGVLKEFIAEDDPEDLIHTEDSDESEADGDIEVWFGWREMVKRYLKTET